MFDTELASTMTRKEQSQDLTDAPDNVALCNSVSSEACSPAVD